MENLKLCLQKEPSSSRAPWPACTAISISGSSVPGRRRRSAACTSSRRETKNEALPRRAACWRNHGIGAGHAPIGSRVDCHWTVPSQQTKPSAHWHGPCKHQAGWMRRLGASWAQAAPFCPDTKGPAAAEPALTGRGAWDRGPPSVDAACYSEGLTCKPVKGARRARGHMAFCQWLGPEST